MSSLTRLALKRPVSSLLIVLALLVFGIGSVFGFKMELTPDMEMPMLFVQTIYQGGDPATTEELVTKIIEDAGKTLSGVESVTSQTTEYISFVMFSYEYGIDIDEAYADLRSALDTASLQLPDDAQDPVIYEMDMNAQDMMTLSVTSTGDTDVLAFVEDELRPELERLSDVAQITVSGGEQDYIRIQLHRDKMQQYGVTMANVRSYIAATDFTVPIGSVDQGAQSISTSASSKPANLMDLQNVPIITARGTTIALSDIATVSMSARANSSISRYNGQDSISIGIAKVQSEGTVDVSNHVKSLVERVAAKNSAIQISVAYDAADSIKSSLSSVAETLVLGVLFSMLALSISASFNGISSFSWFVVSTYRIPLFTTIPTSISTPINEVMFSVEPVMNSRKKDPIRLNGILSMTMSENTGDSNCIAMTRKIRKTAVKIAFPIAVNSSVSISSIIFCV